MSAAKINALILCLGQSYEELLAASVLEEEDFIELFPGIEDLYLEPITGIALRFWAETERLEAVMITLAKFIPDEVLYEGDLPQPYRSNISRADVISQFGEPSKSLGPIKMPVPVGMTGGWDAYVLEASGYPNTRVEFQYLESLEVKGIVFSLADTGRE